MKHSFWFGTSLICIGLLAGCSPKASDPTKAPGSPPVSQGETSNNEAPKQGPTEPTVPDAGAVKKKPPEPTPYTPKIKVDVSEPGKEGWRSTKMGISELSSKLASATKGLRNTKAQTLLLARTSEGEGEYKGEISVKDATRYRIDYVVIEGRPISATDVSDGVRRMIRYDTKWSKPMVAGKPLPVAKRTGKELAAQWPLDFTRIAFQGITDSTDAWQPILAAWAKGAEGFKTVVEERQMIYKGQMILNYRVRAERSPELAKKLGPSTVEIVVDGKHFLPVTIRVERQDVHGKKWLAQWSARWKFQQTLDPKTFNTPLSR